MKADAFTCHCPRTEPHAVTEHLVVLKEFVSWPGRDVHNLGGTTMLYLVLGTEKMLDGTE